MRALARNVAKVDWLDSVKMTPLGWAALQHETNVAEWRLELGANPKHADDLKLTPLTAHHGNASLAAHGGEAATGGGGEAAAR